MSSINVVSREEETDEWIAIKAARYSEDTAQLYVESYGLFPHATDQIEITRLTLTSVVENTARFEGTRDLNVALACAKFIGGSLIKVSTKRVLTVKEEEVNIDGTREAKPIESSVSNRHYVGD